MAILRSLVEEHLAALFFLEMIDPQEQIPKKEKSNLEAQAADLQRYIIKIPNVASETKRIDLWEKQLHLSRTSSV